MTIDPEYETPTLTEIVDLLRPWMHGFTWVGDPTYGVAVCDCGWFWNPDEFGSPAAFHGIQAYQRHVGYEPE